MVINKDYKIIDLENELNVITQIGYIIYEAFKENWKDAWDTHEKAISEVKDLLSDNNINRIATLINGEVIGYISAQPSYKYAWELHPLAVKKKYQNKGIGKSLVYDLENILRKKECITLFLGSDDENYMTSLSKVDLYSNMFERIKSIKNFKNHPYEFYQKLGFSITGVIPDANGYGKPDIIMSKNITI